MPYYYERQRSNIPPVTLNILIVNIIFFVATLINEDFMVGTFGLFYPASQFFRWWQPLTHMFMHGGFWHILFNMYTMVIFGSVVERALGTKRYLVFYFVCGLGAAALHMAVQALQVSALAPQVADGVASAVQSYRDILRTPTVGASGAIYGLLLGYAFLYPDNKLTLLFPPVTLSAKWMVLIFLGIELLTGITGTLDGVAHFAHLGGALFGWLLMLWWRYEATHRRERW